MKSALYLFTSCLLIVLLYSHVVYAENKVQILLTGSFHGDEVAAKDGDLWYGLVKIEDDFFLKPFKISVQLFHDPIIDEKGKKTGKKVSVSGGEPILLIRGLEGLSERKISKKCTVSNINLVNESFQLFPGRVGSCFMDKREVVIYATANVTQSIEWKKKKPNISNYQIYISTKEAVQKVFSISEGMDLMVDYFPPSLLWSGDIDGDGKVDFIIDTTTHYNVSEISLFLSTLAKKGKVLSEPIIFRSYGC